LSKATIFGEKVQKENLKKIAKVDGGYGGGNNYYNNRLI